MIETRELRVDYDGLTAVRDLDLSIGEAEIFGLIGPNGAGKSSTIRVLATLQEPTYGEARIAGHDVLEEPQAVHRVLGYMPDFPPVDDELRVREFLELFAGAYGLPRRERRRRVAECLALVSLEGKAEAMAGTLSRGMKQRLVLAKTLLHDPQVLLLDEPASGLDPIARIELRDVLRGLAARGKTVLISSHILTELDGFCSSIGIMEKGELVIAGRLEALVERFRERRRLVIEVLAEIERALSLLETRKGVSDLTRVDGRLELSFAGDERRAADLLAALVHAGVPVVGFHEERMDVEDILLRVGAREVS